jgi:hypothetical protein
VVLLVSTAVVVCGTNACREDYDFASQSSVPRDGTETPDGTGTPTPSETPTVTPTGSQTAATTATVIPTSADTEDTEEADEARGGDLFNELSALGAKSNPGSSSAAGATVAAGNWLGEAFSKEGEGEWLDGDADGFSDTIEEAAGSDPHRADSMPGGVVTTKLEDRVRPEEVESAVSRMVVEAGDSEDAQQSDSDDDGIPDGIENERGMNPRAADSDSDGLRDDRELVLGTNPLLSDSDGDGISDNREYMLGADPTIPEKK